MTAAWQRMTEGECEMWRVVVAHLEARAKQYEDAMAVASREGTMDASARIVALCARLDEVKCLSVSMAASASSARGAAVVKAQESRKEVDEARAKVDSGGSEGKQVGGDRRKLSVGELKRHYLHGRSTGVVGGVPPLRGRTP